MIYSDADWRIQKQQMETFQKILEFCNKMIEAENDRQKVIMVLDFLTDRTRLTLC